MTFSILARDEKTGALVAAAATGSLCVGGWVIRGALGQGLVASQGTAPSTFWRDTALRTMGAGGSASEAVSAAVSNDPGRGFRQLSALDMTGAGAAHTGAESTAYAAHLTGPDHVVAGNMLSGSGVLEALSASWEGGKEAVPERALAALRAAEAAGGDARGLQSAALLVLHPDRPPLDLRIDMSDAPLDALSRLLVAAQSAPYAGWLDVVPVQSDPTRAP